MYQNIENPVYRWNCVIVVMAKVTIKKKLAVATYSENLGKFVHIAWNKMRTRLE